MTAALTRSNCEETLVRERSALADPYCHLAWNSVCVCVCVSVQTLEVKYLGKQRS